MKVGWIGLGKIGEPMALRVLAAGHDVVGHSRDGRERASLSSAGVRLSRSVEDVVRNAEVVCACLFDDAQVTDVLLKSGALAAMSPGSVLALHTTGVPAVVEALAAAAPGGVDVLDAPFSGTAADAGNGRIRLYVGGDAAALERARPVLSAYCGPVFHFGSVGTARRLKLINNLMFCAQMSLAAEALRAIERLGLPKDAAIEAISLSSGGSYALNVFRRGEVDAVLAQVAHYLDKDAEAARAAARAENLDLKLLDAAAAQWVLPKA
jgi:3-hydroxyisobutyrate dehydrogenase-like beta-hydroxyacid dehydrogenase